MKPKTADRHVGIEIECMFEANVGVESLQNIFNAAGLKDCVQVGTDSSVKSTVKATKEIISYASVNKRISPFGNFDIDHLYNKFKNISMLYGVYATGIPNKQTYKGFEIRVLLPRSNYRSKLNKICNILKDNKAFVNATCGLHVHLDMRDQNNMLSQLGCLLVAQDKFMPTLAKARQRNSYCRKVGTNTKNILRYLSTKDRYSAINMSSLYRHSTIEVRAHEGTINADIINSWIDYLWSVVDNRRSSNKLERYVKVKTKASNKV